MTENSGNSARYPTKYLATGFFSVKIATSLSNKRVLRYYAEEYPFDHSKGTQNAKCYQG